MRQTRNQAWNRNGHNRLVIAQQLQNHRTAHAGDHHRRGRDRTQHEQLDDLAKAQRDGRYMFTLENLHHDNQRKEYCKQHRADRTLLLALHLAQDRGQTAQNQTNEQRVGGQRIDRKGPFQRKAQPANGQHHAYRVGQQGQDGLLEFLEQMRNAMNQRVVNPHGNHHRAAADAGNDVRQTNDHAAKHFQNKFHETGSPFFIWMQELL